MDPSAIREITILPGRNRSGSTRSSSTRATRYRSSAPPAPGKSAFINDIEVFARNDTATGRTVLVNGEYPPEEFVRDPAHKPVALITQNTRCLADLTVEEFLAMHVRSRKIDDESIVGRTIALANEFTGEEIRSGARMTALSGGQTRSLLVADAVMVAAAPVLDLQRAGDRGPPGRGKGGRLRHARPPGLSPLRPADRHAGWGRSSGSSSRTAVRTPPSGRASVSTRPSGRCGKRSGLAT